MKIGIVLPSNIWFCPYISIYTKILDEYKISYDLISWNRDGRDPQIGFQYNQTDTASKNKLAKIVSYIKYTKFVKKIVNKNKYDKLIVSGSQISVFLSSFLKEKYHRKYILDYRDLSIEQKPIIRTIFNRVLANSYFNAISSPGFKKCLSGKYEYTISHNFDISLVNNAVKYNNIIPFKSSPINILTIGGIRNYESNVQVIKSLANKDGMNMAFIGKGIAASRLEKYSKENKIVNIKFKGYYEKVQESSYVKDSSFINIFYPKITSHSTIMSNRFYLALIHKKPMIVTSNSTQGDYVEKYNLGLSVDNCENLKEKLINYITTEEIEPFNERCNNLLKEFVKDYELFKAKVVSFINE